VSGSVIVGEAGTILYTEDDGSTWQIAASGTDSDLRGVMAPYYCSRPYVAVGAAGTILLSNDGKSWRQGASPTQLDLFGVAADDCHHSIWAVGQNGTILNGGTDATNWTVVPSGTSSTLHAVYREQSEARTFAVGEGGTVLRADDSEQWQTLQSSTSEALLAVWVGGGLDEEASRPCHAMLAVGSSGVYVAGADTPMGPASNAGTPTLRGVDGYFAVGNGGAILRVKIGCYPGYYLAPFAAENSGAVDDLYAIQERGSSFNLLTLVVGANGTILRHM
jgi:hypothetical protein